MGRRVHGHLPDVHSPAATVASPEAGHRPRIAGLRVVMSWPDSQFTPKPPPRGRSRTRLAGLGGVALIVGGIGAIGVALLAQQHAPAPPASAAGTTGSGHAKGPALRQSPPVSVAIPAIGVRSQLLHLGLNPDGTIQVPSLTTSADKAAWYKNSVTPGQQGTAVIEGHVDSYQGPAVFFRLGALRPGNQIDVTLADGITAVFRVTGVREYAKDKFPVKTIFGPAHYAALRVITCGGDFDPTTGHYLSSVVVFATLAAAKPR
jgi:Sortase domain